MSTKKSLTLSFLFFIGLSSLSGCGGGGTPSSAINPAASGSGSASSVNSSEVIGTGEATISTGVAKLSWDAPINADGTLFKGFVGYKVYYGTFPITYKNSVKVGMTTNYSVNNLAPGTYYFAVTIYDSSGNESSYSNEERKTIL